MTPADASPSAERRVLVIDDEESLRHALRKALRRSGYVVETAATGREGVDLLRSGRFDAVVTDIRLPDLSGVDIVALVTETSPDTPVLVMTGYGTVDTALEAMRRGARDFVTKPFDTAELVQRVDREVERGRPGEDGKRLRVKVERRFAPEGYAQVDDELRRAPSAAIAADGSSTTSAASGPAAHAHEVPGASGDPLALREAQRQFEVRYVEDLLSRTGGNVAAAARLAGISRPNFHKKLKVLGVDPTRFKEAHRRGRTAGL
jgi:DNA-binding NtrC family response regulator